MDKALHRVGQRLMCLGTPRASLRFARGPKGEKLGWTRHEDGRGSEACAVARDDFTEVDDVAGAFSLDQDTLTNNDCTFYMTSAATDPNGVPLHSSSDDSVFQNLAIAIDGLVDNPTDLKPVDIPEDQLATRVPKLHCSANGMGDALIANVEFAGVSFDRGKIRQVCEAPTRPCAATGFHVAACRAKESTGRCPTSA